MPVKLDGKELISVTELRISQLFLVENMALLSEKANMAI